MKEMFRKNFGYALLTMETREELANIMQGQRVLELGAGTGYMSACLHSRGVDIKASDSGDWDHRWATVWQRDIREKAEDIDVSIYPYVLAVWPLAGCEWMYEVLDKMSVGQTLVLQGETPGGCTGHGGVFNNSDWQERTDLNVKLNQDHVQFRNVKDEWHVFERISEPVRLSDSIKLLYGNS